MRKQNQGKRTTKSAKLVDAGDILARGGVGIDAEFVIASIHEACGRSTDLISSDPMAGGGGERQFREVEENVSEVVGDSNDMAHRDTTNAAVHGGWRSDAEGVIVNNSNSSHKR